MPRIKFYLPALLCVIALGLWVPYESRSQVGQSQLVNPDLASEKELLALPHMNVAIVKSILAQRPFLNMADLHALLSKTLSKEQLAELYGKMFVQINLNTAANEEILLIPGVGSRMLREFKEYRPYSNIEQFRKEIGKYVDKKEVARLERYVTLN
jgi:DNA uptake protein ComE-like DNA-binding protein